MLRKNFWLQCLLISGVYLPFLSKSYFPLTWDQRLYISTTLEMLNSGNWLQPRLLDAGSYYKPPLQYWATLLSWKVFGISFFSTLFPSFLAALLTCFLIERIAENLQGPIQGPSEGSDAPTRPRVGTGASLCFFSTLGTFVFATSAQMEIYLCLFYAAGWWAALNYLSSSKKLWLYATFAIAGVSSWVKSPLYSVLWIGSFLLYLVLRRRLDLLNNKHFYFALLGGAILGLSWYLYILQVDPENFWNQYVVQETLNKKNGSGHGPLFPWLGLVFWAIPWTLFIPSTLFRAWSTQRTRPFLRRSPLLDWFLAWVIPPAFFFTLHPFRMDPYLYLFFPALALLLDQVWKDPDLWVWHQKLTYRFSLALLTGLVFILGIALRNSGLVAPWIGFGFFATSLFCGTLLFLRPQISYYRTGALATLFLFAATVQSLGNQDLQGLLAFKGKHADQSFAILDLERNPYQEVGWLSVALSQPIRRIGSYSDAIDFMKSGGALLVPPHEADHHFREIHKWMKASQPMSLQEVPWQRLGGKGGIRARDLLSFSSSSSSLYPRFFESGKILVGEPIRVSK